MLPNQFALSTFTAGNPVPPSFDPGRYTPAPKEPTLSLPADVEKLRAGVKIPAFLPYYDVMQNVDETATMRMCYRRMLADPNIKGPFLSKIFSVMALNLNVSPPKRLKKDVRSVEIAEFSEWTLKHGMSEGIPGMVWDIFSGGLIDGFSVCEKIWGGVEPKGRWRGKRRLRALKAKDVDQDLVIEIDEFKNITGIRGLRYNGGEVFDPKDFVIYTHLGLFENPTGMSDFRAVYARYWILDAVWKLRAMACDKRAIPLLIGLWKDPANRGNLEAALAKARYQNWISAPADAQIQAVNIAGQADSIFAETIRDLREEIVIGIKGSTLTSMTSSDERGDSKVHKDTTDLWGWQLSAAILNLLNGHEFGLLRDIIDRNYTGVDEYPLASFGGVDDAELAETLAIDKGLQEMGWPLDKEELEERYGRKWQDDPALAVMKPQPAPMGGMPGGPGGGPGTPGATGGDTVPTEDDFASVLNDMGQEQGQGGSSNDGKQSAVAA